MGFSVRSNLTSYLAVGNSQALQCLQRRPNNSADMKCYIKIFNFIFILFIFLNHSILSYFCYFLLASVNCPKLFYSRNQRYPIWIFNCFISRQKQEFSLVLTLLLKKAEVSISRMSLFNEPWKFLPYIMLVWGVWDRNVRIWDFGEALQSVFFFSHLFFDHVKICDARNRNQ